MISNSSEMQELPDGGTVFLASPVWNGELTHWEFMLTLSSGTNSDGAVAIWRNGVQIALQSDLRFNRDSTDAARNIEQFQIGGWNSGNNEVDGGPEGNGNWRVWPITRVILEWRVAYTRQGVWSITV